MSYFCSTYCLRWDECNKLGYLDFIKVIPIHPDEADRGWCPDIKFLPLPDTEEGCRKGRFDVNPVAGVYPEELLSV